MNPSQNKVLTYARHALNCLIGKPAACIWETSVVGYDVTHWRTDADGTWHPMAHCFVETAEQAKAVAKRYTRMMTE